MQITRVAIIPYTGGAVIRICIHVVMNIPRETTDGGRARARIRRDVMITIYYYDDRRPRAVVSVDENGFRLRAHDADTAC